MIKQILAGYGAALGAAIRFLALLAICVGAGALVVYPLWRLADSNPSLYSLVFGILFSAILLAFIVSRAAPSFRRDPLRFLVSLARKATLAGGLILCVALVLAWHRVAALVALAATLAIYGFLAFGLKKAPGRSAP